MSRENESTRIPRQDAVYGESGCLWYGVDVSSLALLLGIVVTFAGFDVWGKIRYSQQGKSLFKNIT